MRLTTKGEYALIALISLARHPSNAYVQAGKISQQYHISEKYLDSILSILKQHHIIIAKRGFGGGYRLAKDKNAIIIADIVRLMDGALAPVPSTSKFFYEPTVLEKEKKLHGIFQEIRDYIAKRLEHTTLADVL